MSAQTDMAVISTLLDEASEQGLEVIDHTADMLGRMLVKYGVNVEVSIQDDGRTMKVF